MIFVWFFKKILKTHTSSIKTIQTLSTVMSSSFCHQMMLLSSTRERAPSSVKSVSTEKNTNEKREEVTGGSQWSLPNRIPCSWAHRRECWEAHITSLWAKMSNISSPFFVNKHAANDSRASPANKQAEGSSARWLTFPCLVNDHSLDLKWCFSYYGFAFMIKPWGVCCSYVVCFVLTAAGHGCILIKNNLTSLE